MFNHILGYLRNACDDLDFTAWEVVSALVLPDLKKSEPQKFEDHSVISNENLAKLEKQENNILDVLGMSKKNLESRGV